jgi:hypothetical protein
VLVLMSVGTYQVSQVIARQHELQSGADEAMAISLAGWNDNSTQVSAIKDVLQRSTGVTAANITIDRFYRCGSDTAYVTDKSTCASTQIVSTFLKLKLKDTYTPVWTSFGVGQPINLAVTRMVQIS